MDMFFPFLLLDNVGVFYLTVFRSTNKTRAHPGFFTIMKMTNMASSEVVTLRCIGI